MIFFCLLSFPRFAENVSSIQENFQNVEKRVSQLQHKK